MDLELVGAVLELVGVAVACRWDVVGRADGNDPGIALDGDRGAGDEAARLVASHQVGRRVAPPLRHHADYLAEELPATQQGRDVAKHDSRLREVGDIPHVLLQLLGRRHTTDLKYSSVRARPSSSATSGSQPSSVRARVMSGRRCFGSSTGSSRWTISLFEPASRTIVSASSSTVTSLGLPRFTGISSPRSSTARMPRTRSDTYWRLRVWEPSPYTVSGSPLIAWAMKLGTARPSDTCMRGP